MKILIAEDEPDMLKILKLYLMKEGYEVSEASNGEEAWDMLCNGSFDLLIADWMMPKMDGVMLCREVRACELPLKIIMLTAKGTADNEITGLTSGADDYVRKPFEPRVLLLRIKKLLQLEEAHRCGKILLDQRGKRVFVQGAEVKLKQKEYQLLELFMKNQGITLTRDFLLDRVWGCDYEGDERTLDTHIRRLRGKIGESCITTYVGVGYRMEKADE